MLNNDSSLDKVGNEQVSKLPETRPLSTKTIVGVCLALCIAGVAALTIDLSVARWALDNRCPKILRELFALSEVFSHGLGVAMLILVVATLDRPGLLTLFRICLASLGAGLAANLLKISQARWRPRDFDFLGRVGDTFGQIFPGLSGGGSLQSFPSAHSAVAAGFAVAMIRLYPRGRYLFPLLALFAMAQRVESGAHFLSDTFWGAAVGVAVGGIASIGIATVGITISQPTSGP